MQSVLPKPDLTVFEPNLILALAKLTVLCRDHYDINPISNAIAAVRANGNKVGWEESNQIYIILDQIRAIHKPHGTLSAGMLELLEFAINILYPIASSEPTDLIQSLALPVVARTSSSPTQWYQLS